MTTKTKHTRHEYNPKETNWAALTFPTDTHGIMADLRREVRAAVLRCRGSEERFQMMLDNLEVLLAWARMKVAEDRADIQKRLQEVAEREEQAARREEFRARIQAGQPIKVTATDTGFIEKSPRTGNIVAVYDTADDPRGAIAAMAALMIEEGRNPNTALVIDAFGVPGIGSGLALRELASPPATDAAGAARRDEPLEADTRPGLQGINV